MAGWGEFSHPGELKPSRVTQASAPEELGKPENNTKQNKTNKSQKTPTGPGLTARAKPRWSGSRAPVALISLHAGLAAPGAGTQATGAWMWLCLCPQASGTGRSTIVFLLIAVNCPSGPRPALHNLSQPPHLSGPALGPSRSLGRGEGDEALWSLSGGKWEGVRSNGAEGNLAQVGTVGLEAQGGGRSGAVSRCLVLRAGGRKQVPRKPWTLKGSGVVSRAVPRRFPRLPSPGPGRGTPGRLTGNVCRPLAQNP